MRSTAPYVISVSDWLLSSVRAQDGCDESLTGPLQGAVDSTERGPVRHVSWAHCDVLETSSVSAVNDGVSSSVVAHSGGVPWLLSPESDSELTATEMGSEDSLVRLLSPGPPLSPVMVGVGVDGGVKDVSDDMDARANRLFLRGVT